MRNTITLLTILAVVGLFALPAVAGAQDPDGTLWDQEGTGNDGYSTIDASPYSGPTGTASDSWTNWQYQYGGGTWSGVYRKDGWLEESSSGDPNLDIEADIEMYYSEEYTKNKIYFHIGNIYTALQSPGTDLTTTFSGKFSSNNGMYIGISFDGTGKTPEDMLQDAGGYTGEVQDAMVGTIDVLGRDISSEAFNAKFLLQWDGSGWQTPVSYGTGASGTILNTLWWLVNNGAKGSYDIDWQVELLPEEHQADGNYKFDPSLVVAPVL